MDAYQLDFPTIYDAFAAEASLPAGSALANRGGGAVGSARAGSRSSRFGPLSECGYQTVELSNISDSPCTYSFADDPTGHFSVCPSQGYVEPGSFVLVAVRYSPGPLDDSRLLSHDIPSTRLHACDMAVSINGSEADGVCLKLRGSAALPRLALPNGGIVYGRPTCVGARSTAEVKLASATRVPARYRWRIPPSAQDVLAIFPIEGHLLGND